MPASMFRLTAGDDLKNFEHAFILYRIVFTGLNLEVATVYLLVPDLREFVASGNMYQKGAYYWILVHANICDICI